MFRYLCVVILGWRWPGEPIGVQRVGQALGRVEVNARARTPLEQVL